MIDDEDVDIAMLLAPTGGSGWCGVIVGVLGISFVIALIIIASMNHQDCSKRQCPEGQKPILMHHECLCVTEAK